MDDHPVALVHHPAGTWRRVTDLPELVLCDRHSVTLYACLFTERCPGEMWSTPPYPS